MINCVGSIRYNMGYEYPQRRMFDLNLAGNEQRCYPLLAPQSIPTVYMNSFGQEVVTQKLVEKYINDDGVQFGAGNNIMGALESLRRHGENNIVGGIRRMGTKMGVNLNDSPRYRSGYAGERHMMLPAYGGISRGNFAGPGTNIRARLLRGDKGVDGDRGIDEAAKQHDIDYLNAESASDVRKADKVFVKRVKRSSGNKMAKKAVIGAMKAKQLGEDLGVINPSLFAPDIKKRRRKKPAQKLREKLLKKFYE